LELAALLRENATTWGAARAVIERGLVEQLGAAVPRLREDARRPAGVEGIVGVLTPWFATYPQPQRSEQEWEAWWRAYALICENISAAALHGAMLAWARRPESEFLPKPGQLAAIAQETPTAAMRDATHAWQVLSACRDMLQPPREDTSAADEERRRQRRADIAGLLSDFKSKSLPAVERSQRVLQRGAKGAEIPDAELPYSGGTLAPGSALTPQMLRLLGRPVPQAPPPADDFEFSEEAGG
jgi:hypothetical protein